MTQNIETQISELNTEVTAIENRAATYTSLTEMRREAARRKIEHKNVKVDPLRELLLAADTAEVAAIKVQIAALEATLAPAAPALDPNAPAVRQSIVQIAGRRALEPGYSIAVIQDQSTNGVEIYLNDVHVGSFFSVSDALKGLGKHSKRVTGEGYAVKNASGQSWLYKKSGDALLPIDQNGVVVAEFCAVHAHKLHQGDAELATFRLAGTIASVTNSKEVQALVKNAAIERPALRKESSETAPKSSPTAETSFKFGNTIVRATSLAQARKLFLDSLTVEVVVEENAPAAPEVAPETEPSTDSAPVAEIVVTVETEVTEPAAELVPAE